MRGFTQFPSPAKGKTRALNPKVEQALSIYSLENSWGSQSTALLVELGLHSRVGAG